MEKLDLKLCRLCYENPGSSFIYEDIIGLSISSQIGYCCSKVCIIKNDELPSYICSRCNDQLKACYYFILKCEDTDRKLRLLIEDYKLKIIKNEDSDGPYCDGFNNDTPLEIIDNEVKILDKNETKWNKNNNQTFKKKTKKQAAGTFSCTVCGRHCQNQSTLEIHMRAHTNEKPFSCKSCDKKYKDLGSLKRHKERNHSGNRERNFICDHCGKRFYSKHDVVIHMRTHTGETPYACNICPKRFTQLSTQIRHQKRHSGDRSQICLTCNKKFCTKQELQNHYLVHTSDKNYSCSICNTLFKYKNNLKKHVRQHIAPNKFVCNYCGRVFTLKGNLKIHIDRQHSPKSGQCHMCLKHVSNIELHKFIHTGERPLKCEHCPKTYFHKNALDRHNNLWHKYPNKYKCTINSCSLSFPSQSMLNFHLVKYHGNVIPFPCDRCSRGFYRRNDLARHKIGTHKERLTEQ